MMSDQMSIKELEDPFKGERTTELCGWQTAIRLKTRQKHALI